MARLALRPRLTARAARKVHTARHRLKVSWVHASTYTAQVVEVEARGDWTNKLLV
jgi:hypothetical protein